MVREAWTGLEDNLEGAISRFFTRAWNWNREILEMCSQEKGRF